MKKTKILIFAFSLLVAVGAFGQEASQSQDQGPKPMDPKLARQVFESLADGIDPDKIRYLATQNNGRIKPLDTLAREAILFIHGKYSLFGRDAVRAYLAMILTDATPSLQIIEVREPSLRKRLALPLDRRHYSAFELEQSPLQLIAQPLFAKEEQMANSLNPDEKKVLEVYHQMQFVRGINSGGHFLSAVDFSTLQNKGAMPLQQEGTPLDEAKKYLTAVAQNNSVAARESEQRLLTLARTQSIPKIFERYMDKIDLEVTYNHFRFFFWAGMLYAVLAFVFVSPFTRRFLTKTRGLLFFLVPLSLHVVGFATRVVVTGFAPVTNMFGTMMWVGFGVTIFSMILLALYGNFLVVGLLAAGSSLLLLLTESMPLILSPDLDPIVAVLRSNYWLTIHVLTITISYAALTIAMLIGNAGLIRTIYRNDNELFYKEYSHYAYRMMQLGVFLLTAGIILGGVWADYSWGRFWGWDPKETWALIADVGFLAILHARYVGWLRNFGLLAAGTIAYLLVVMAWYGVNFILATGLHSYGFSSGGTAIVISFVSVQLILFGVAMFRYREKHGKFSLTKKA